MVHSYANTLVVAAISFFAYACSPASSAFGSVVVTAVEEGGNVIFRGEGTIDTSALTLLPIEVEGVSPGVNTVTGLRLQPLSNTPIELYEGNFSPLPDFGVRRAFHHADRSSGDTFGIFETLLASTAEGGPAGRLHLPVGYVSGDSLAGTMTYLSSNFQRLAVEPGTYSTSWKTTSGTDTFTLRVIIPEPSTIALLFPLVLNTCRHRRR